VVIYGKGWGGGGGGGSIYVKYKITYIVPFSITPVGLSNLTVMA